MKAVISLTMTAAIFLAACSATANGGREMHPAGEWIELFNGKDMTGWRMTGKGSFDIVDGSLVTRGGMGLLYYEARKFRDFTLRVEWKVDSQCNNSGIFVRFPEQTNDPWYAVHNGYEIQIDDCDKRGLKHQTGSVYDFAPAAKLASKPAGEWNVYEITIVGQQYTIVLNGEKVTEFEGSRGRDGYIGLQNHDPISRVSFRRVAVREITSAQTQ